MCSDSEVLQHASSIPAFQRCIRVIREQLRCHRFTGEACLWHKLRKAGFSTELVHEAMLSMYKLGRLQVVFHHLPIQNRVLRFFYLDDSQDTSQEQSYSEAA